MEVEVVVKVDGKLVKAHVQQVQGTLEQMEEAVHALSKQVAGEALQAAVHAVAGPRPLFRKTAADSGTAATRRGR